MSYEKTESPTSKVTVAEKIKPTLSISPQEVSAAVGQKVTFGGKLLDPLTGPIKGRTVYLVVGKEEVASTTTDDGGNWQITYTFENAGKYNVKAVFKG